MRELRGPLRRTARKAALSAHEVVDLGLGTSAAIVANSVRTARQNLAHRDRWRRTTVARGPGRLLGAEAVVTAAGTVGVRCRFTDAELELLAVAPRTLRVSWGPDRAPLPWGLVPQMAEPPGVPAALEIAGDPPERCVLTTGACRVTLDADGTLVYADGDGRVVRTELPPRRRGTERTLRALVRHAERVCGLGEQASGVDLAGTTHRLWNRDPGGAWGPGQDPLYCSIPVLTSLHPDGDVLVFVDNPAEATVAVDPPAEPVAGARRVEATFAGGMLRHFVALGDLGGPDGVLAAYGALTGLPPLPPRWALGYHQCRWGYRDEGMVREVAAGFAAEGLPLSALHLDIDHMDGYRVFTVDPERFPDLPGLSAALGARGTRVVTIVDPAVKVDPDAEVYAEGTAAGHFVRDPDGDQHTGVVWPGRAAFPDFTDPVVRRWWAGLYRRLTDQGVAGIWHDMNEPTSIALWGDRTLPLATPHVMEGRGGDHREAHNPYGILMNEAGFEGLRAARPDRRPFLVSRAGWAGLQRHAWNWTADIESSFEGLAQQVPTIVGLGLSGVPYSGSDIGGFSGTPSPELYVRWLELSVLMPFCRTHCVLGAPPREPWRFPEPERGLIAGLIRFRYRLLPYLYTLADEAATLGAPFVRPMAWPAPGATRSSGDARLFHVDDQFLLGDALCVAPVSRRGARARSVVLPEGSWFRWRALEGAGAEAELVAGGTTEELDAPLGAPVLCVRAGTVLPLDDGAFDDGALDPGHAPRRLTFHCFPDAEGTAVGSCYDDAGDGDGPFRRDRVTLARPARARRGTLEVRVERTGEFPAPARTRVVLHGLAVGEASAGGEAVTVHVATDGAGRPTSVVETGAVGELRLRQVTAGPAGE